MKKQNIFALFLAICVLFTFSMSVMANDRIIIELPDVSIGYIYQVIPQKYGYVERFERTEVLAQAFGVQIMNQYISDIRQINQNFAILMGENRWSYGYNELSGHDFFVDLDRFLRANPEEGLPLIDENEAVGIASNFVENVYVRSSNVSINRSRFSRVWNCDQLTPDEGERIIQKTSNEAVVKLFRTIDGIPVYGQGYYRIHIGNDGSVTGAFDSCRKFDEIPIGIIDMPTYDEVEQIAEAKRDYYCASAKNCYIRARVGYYEADRSTAQYFLEPVINFDISVLTQTDDRIAYNFQIPLRDPEEAEIIVHEFEIDY